MSNRLASAQVSERVPAPSFALSHAEYAYHLQRANEMRGEAMAEMFVKAWRWIAKLVRTWQQSVAEGRAMRELASLDDRMLADIGVTRSDIPGVVRRAHVELVHEQQLAQRPSQRRAA
jgi:uncharacterized protein YjiS (DUF1127 family)